MDWCYGQRGKQRRWALFRKRGPTLTYVISKVTSSNVPLAGEHCCCHACTRTRATSNQWRRWILHDPLETPHSGGGCGPLEGRTFPDFCYLAMLKSADLQRLLENDGDGYTEATAEDVDEAIQKVTPKEPQEAETEVVLCDGAVRNQMIKRAAERSARIGDGCTIAYRTAEGEPLSEAVLGGATLPWALEVTARRLQVGDVVDVVATGEHALADDEALDGVSGVASSTERKWRFEVATVKGTPQDKFRLTVEERIEVAQQLRERGNAMLKQGRLLRACDHYERGSGLMDVIEAEDMGMPGSKKDATAVANNQRLRECQQPLLLNWALALMRRKQWHEAERKCSEVLLDIDGACVKALFRRGQCQVQLGNLEDAKKDLLKARDLENSIADDVEKELVKLKRQQKVLDQKDRGWAQKALQKGLADERSKLPAAQLEVSEEECRDKETTWRGSAEMLGWSIHDAMASMALAGNAACWRAGFSYATCCGKPGGNSECFDALYTYEVCCLNSPLSWVWLPYGNFYWEHIPSSIFSQADWDVFFLAHQLSQTLGSSYKGWPDLPALLSKANASGSVLEASEADCAFGLVAILQTLSSIEKQSGSFWARKAYNFAYRVLARAGPGDCRWNDMINHAVFSHTDMLLGLEPGLSENRWDDPPQDWPNGIPSDNQTSQHIRTTQTLW
eukprot:s605_g7.t1